MQPSEKIREYSKAVCGQMRWKKAHAVIAEEIEGHLADQRDAYMSDGADEAVATDKAIVQMGDPVAVGTQLDRTHRPKPQWGMLALVAVFVCMGTALNISNNWGTGYGWMLNLFLHQASGMAVMAAAFFLDFSWIGRYPRVLLPLLMALFTFGFIWAAAAGYNFYWAYSGLMLLLPLGFAGLVYSLRNKGPLSILLCEAIFLIPVLLLFIMEVRWLRSQCVLYAVSALVILLVAVSKGWFSIKKRSGSLLVILPLAVTLIAALLIMYSNGRLERIWNTFNLPYSRDNISGWEGFFIETKTTLARSKFIGRGIMPDGPMSFPGGVFLLTGWVFKYGWISVIPLFALLLFFIVKGFRLCFRQKSVLGLLISVSVMMTLTMQVICYVLLDFGVYLLSNIPLPLIMQYSWLEYVVNMALVGLMLSVFRTGDAVKDRTIQKRRLIDAAGA